MLPPALSHLNTLSRDNREELCALCGSSLHMSKGEVKLLRYYAAQSNGFRPALQHIANQTGMTRRHIERARTMLQNHGVAKIDDGRIYIDWERIRLFSTLDPALTSKHCYVAPVRVKKCPYKVYYVPKSFLLKLRTCSVLEACNILARLPRPVYRAVCSRLA